MGTHVTVVGITENSLQQSYVILGASLGTDPGFFGEKLAHCRQEIVRARKARCVRLKTTANQTDILGALVLAGELFAERPNAPQKMLIVYSNMRQATAELNLERNKRFQRSAVVVHVKAMGLIEDLSNVQAYVLGANSTSSGFVDAQGLQEFWRVYFHEAGASLRTYSVLRDMPNDIPRGPKLPTRFLISLCSANF